MNKTEMMYKADTGKRCYKRYESEPIKDAYTTTIQAVDIYAFPEEYIDDDDLLIPTPDYIKWLEEKVEQLSPKQ